jgi:hypothetical protein
MAKKPAGDLGAMAISKTKAAEAVPFSTASQAVPAAGGVKSLTVKLEADVYAALRAYCYEQERHTGNRVTHQQVMVEAIKAFLANPSL